MGHFFGTDGIRGRANDGLDAPLALKVGQAAALVLAKENKHKPLIVIGKDTRISSDFLEAALIAGICSSGADVLTLGVVPTPAVAYITGEAGADAGIVISASHNPYEYNGIKIFNSKGFKLSDELEAEIEELILSHSEMPLKRNGDIGRVHRDSERYVDRYINRLASLAEGMSGGLKLVVDCANGAAFRTAERLFSQFPVKLHMMFDKPDGVNINCGCGSTELGALSEEVRRLKYDMGIAFDGDADRCMVVDEQGNVVDGDKMMAICGSAMKQAGLLKNDTIVATVYSNVGFQKYAEQSGITVLSAAPGDRNVLELMQKTGANLGGEQSGHLIFLDDTTTGDGQLAAIKFLNVVSAQKRKVSELVAQIPEYPQFLKNVPIEGGNTVKERIMSDESLKSELSKAENELENIGRILLRPSGTEALIRVMVEASDEKVAFDIAERLAEHIKKLAAETKNV